MTQSGLLLPTGRPFLPVPHSWLKRACWELETDALLEVLGRLTWKGPLLVGGAS